MFEQILVPLDSSEAAERVLPYVTMLAKRLGSRLTLVSVIDDTGDLNPVASIYDAEIARLAEFRSRRAHEYLDRVSQRLAAEGIDSHKIVRAGAVSDEIASVAVAEQTDIIAMATHGRVGAARWVLGSVADAVLRLAPVPVLLVRPQDDEGAADPRTVQRIVLPLDGSPLAETAIPYATELARALGVPITAVRDIPTLWISGLDPTGATVASPELVQSIVDEAETYLNGIVARLRAAGVTADSRRADALSPATDIACYAEETPGALVVMTTHGRSALRRTILGGVTDRVVRTSGAPVLVVHPTAHE